MLSSLERTRPDYVFHLAAQSFVPASWTAPNETLTTNITGQVNLFEAIRALRLDPVVQIACSSEQYGLVLPDETPIKETNPLRPLSSYAVSKVAQDLLGYQYFQSYGLKAIRTRGGAGVAHGSARSDTWMSAAAATAPVARWKTTK